MDALKSLRKVAASRRGSRPRADVTRKTQLAEAICEQFGRWPSACAPPGSPSSRDRVGSATSTRQLVEDIEDAILPPIMRAMLDEVVGPYVVAMLRPQADARSSVSHRRPRLGCFLGTFSPSRRQIRSTRLLFTTQPVAALRRLALCRAVLAERRTGATLGYAKLTTNIAGGEVTLPFNSSTRTAIFTNVRRMVSKVAPRQRERFGAARRSACSNQ